MPSSRQDPTGGMVFSRDDLPLAKGNAPKQSSRVLARGRMKTNILWIVTTPILCTVQVLDRWFHIMRGLLLEVDLLYPLESWQQVGQQKCARQQEGVEGTTSLC